MNEKDLNVKGRANINNIVDSEGDLNIKISFENIIENDGTDIVELQDSNVASSSISEEHQIKNSIESIECELVIEEELTTNCEIDIDGNFYINDVDSDKYEINENAELIFNH